MPPGGRFRSAGAQRERFCLRKIPLNRFRNSLGSMCSLGRCQRERFGAVWGCPGPLWGSWRPPVGLFKDLFGFPLGSLGVSLGQVGLLKVFLGGVCVCMLWYGMVCYVMSRHISFHDSHCTKHTKKEHVNVHKFKLLANSHARIQID